MVERSNVTEIIVGATVAVVLVVMAFLVCYFLGFFKRKTAEERAKEDGLTDTGFANHDSNLKEQDTVLESTKMLQA